MDRLGALRVTTLGAQAEMALVRRDPVAAPLLAQAARAAGEEVCAALLDQAATLVRVHGVGGEDGPARARRKAAQALVRSASQRAQAVLLGGAPA